MNADELVAVIHHTIENDHKIALEFEFDANQTPVLTVFNVGRASGIRSNVTTMVGMDGIELVIGEVLVAIDRRMNVACSGCGTIREDRHTAACPVDRATKAGHHHHG